MNDRHRRKAAQNPAYDRLCERTALRFPRTVTTFLRPLLRKSATRRRARWRRRCCATRPMRLPVYLGLLLAAACGRALDVPQAEDTTSPPVTSTPQPLTANATLENGLPY